MRCDNCHERDAYGMCRYPHPNACDACPCKGCSMCKDEQKVVAIQKEKIRRIEKALGHPLTPEQAAYVLSLGDPPADKEERRDAYYVRICLYPPPYSRLSRIPRANKMNLHRLDDARELALGTEEVRLFKYHLQKVYKLLQGTGLRLRILIF